MHIDNRDREIGIIYDFLGEAFPNALMQPADEPDIEEELRLRSAGMGLARVATDGEVFNATYIRDANHPAANALKSILELETRGQIPEGSHDQAIDALVLGMPGPLDEFLSRHLD